MDFDVIIIGAGPAGSTAAYHLAQMNFKVLILDQELFPRYKSCGGGIPLRVLWELPYDLSPALDFLAQGGEVSFKGHTKLRAILDGNFAWLAMRDKMDQFMLEKAIQSGVTAKTGTRVSSVRQEEKQIIVNTADTTYSSRYLIGADGVNSIVARTMGLLVQRKTGIAIEAEISVPGECMSQQGKFVSFDFGAIPHGYGWIFPKREHLSVGIFQASDRKHKQIKNALDKFIASQPVLKQHEILKIRGHRIPLGGDQSILHSGHALLVGDAANLADPWLGEGIYYAVRSGGIAASILGKALRNESDDLSEYTRCIEEEIINDFKYSKRIAQFIYRFPAPATTLISRSRIMQQFVFSNIRGDITFQKLWKSLVLKFPSILYESIFNGGERSK